MVNRINFAIEGKIAYITMNRPEKRNAIDDSVVAEISECFGEANANERVRAIVFRGEGSAFSAGADLEYVMKLSQNSPSANLDDSNALKNLLLEVYESKKLVCAIVRGPALAGAFGLVLACDVVFASEKAKFGFTEVKIGFVPAIVLNFALRKLRECDVRKLVLTGNIIGAAEAMRVGIISELINDDEVESKAENFLKEFVSGTSRNAIALTKEILSEVRGMTFDEALKYGVVKNVEARSTDDFKKGVNAFLNKKHLEWE
ncbi:MAG: enoyl-CoA hydratase-related protein [Candidatus Kryptoniota bacterium]